MANFIEIKSINPKSKQSEIAKELKITTSTLQRYRREGNMLSPYRIPPTSNTHTRKQKTEHDLKVISNDLKMTSNDCRTTSKNRNENGEKVKTENNLRGGDPNDNPAD